MISPEEKPHDTVTKDDAITFADFERAMREAAKPHDEQPDPRDEPARD